MESMRAVEMEETLYQDGDLVVTSRTVRTASRTIAIANVAAATVETFPASRAPGIVVAAVGGVVGGVCLASGGESLVVGLVFALAALAIGAAMAMSAHERYMVRVELLGGKAHKFHGTGDRAIVEAAVAAINRAAEEKH
jgi:hypothetical protein